MGKLRAGIIGTGIATGISYAHYIGYQKSECAYVTAVYNRRTESAEAWCRKYGIEGVKVCRSLEDFFKEVDIVSICTPNDTHVQYIKECLKAGKHVLCEKPVGAGEEKLADLEKECRKAGVVQMVDFNYRKIPGIRFLSELNKQGTLGEIVLYRHTMGAGRLANEMVGFEWRMDRKCSGSGSLGDFGSHILDTMLFITGKDRRISAAVSRWKRYRYKNGCAMEFQELWKMTTAPLYRECWEKKRYLPFLRAAWGVLETGSK